MNIKIKDNTYNIDKKYFIIVAIILLIIIFLAIFSNDSKTLKCTLNLNSDTATTSEIYTATFKKNKLKNLIVYFKNSPTSNYLDMIDDIYNNYKTQLDELENNGGYTYILEKNNIFVSFESKINLDKIPDSTKTKLGFNNQWTYENFKNDLEKNGFNCE